MKFAERRRIVTLGFMCQHKAKTYLGGFLLGFGSITTITFILVVLGAIEVDVNHLYTMDILVRSLWVSIFGWMIQSTSEEIAIRGWLIPTLGMRYHPLAAVLLTGGTFGIIHLLGNGATVLSFINLTLSGFFFALYAIITGSDLFTGGDFGPEGGFITTLFLACAVLLITLIMYRKYLAIISTED